MIKSMIKKAITLCIVFALTIHIPILNTSATQVLIGDINNDGKTDVSDVIALRTAISEKTYNSIGDINLDGACTEQDIVLLKAYILGTYVDVNENIAYQKAVSASSCVSNDSTDALSKLSDGSGSTFALLSPDDTQKWLSVDLGGHYDINKVTLYWGNNGFSSNCHATSYTIDVKQYENSEWVTVATVTDGTIGENTLSFNSIDVSFVRVSIASTASDTVAIGEFAVYKTNIDANDVVADGYTIDDTTDTGLQPGTVLTAKELRNMQQSAKDNFSSALEERSESLIWFIGDSAFCGDVYFDNTSANNTPATSDTIAYYTTYLLNELMGCHELGYEGGNTFSSINDAYFGRRLANIYNATRYNQNADITIIHAGINDADPGSTTPLDVFAEQLAQFLMREIARGSYVVYMLPLDTAYTESFEYYLQENNYMGMFAARSKQYSAVARSVCEALGVDVFDSAKAQEGTVYFEETMDTVHPSANARGVICNRLCAFLASEHPKMVGSGDIVDPASEKLTIYYDEKSYISGGKLYVGEQSTIFLLVNYGEDNLCLYPKFESLNGRVVMCIPPQGYAPRINDPYALEGLTEPASFSSYTVITEASELTAQYGESGLLEGNFLSNSQDGLCLIGIYTSGGCVIENFEIINYTKLKK